MTTEKAAPTPKTDAAYFTLNVRGDRIIDPRTGEPKQLVSADFARQLERESIRLAERLKEAREALQTLADAAGTTTDGRGVGTAITQARSLLRSGEGE